MHRPSRTVALAGASALLAVLGPAGVASAASPVAVATSAAQDPGPTADHGSMPGMDHGSMTTPGPGATADHGSQPGSTGAHGGHGGHGDQGGGHDDAAGMPGMAPDHSDAASVSRPVAWVVGAFVVVNGLMMAAAAVLRRRRPVRPVTRRPRAATV